MVMEHPSLHGNTHCPGLRHSWHLGALQRFGGVSPCCASVSPHYDGAKQEAGFNPPCAKGTLQPLGYI